MVRGCSEHTTIEAEEARKTKEVFTMVLRACVRVCACVCVRVVIPLVECVGKHLITTELFLKQQDKLIGRLR